MVFHLKRDISSSPHPSTSDLEVGFLSIESVNGEGILSEVLIGSLEESLHGIACLKEHLAFTLSLIIKHFPA